MQIDPEAQFQINKYARKIPKIVFGSEYDQNMAGEYKSSSSGAFLKMGSHGTHSSNRVRLFTSKLVNKNAIKFGSSLNSKSCMM